MENSDNPYIFFDFMSSENFESSDNFHNLKNPDNSDTFNNYDDKLRLSCAKLSTS